MSLDAYSYCPCGSGKKIKFCCSKDIPNDLGRILRAIEGEQRAAALDQIEKAIKDHGDRDCLVALKANLQIALGDVENAESSITTLMKSAPHNPIALALMAVVEVTKDRPEAAIETLQRSLESIEEYMPHAVYSAIGVLAQALMSSGNVLAAHGHLAMQVGLAGENDRSPLSMLMQLNMAQELPLLLREDYVFSECPEDVAWRGEFNTTMKSAKRGAWLAACESLNSLSEKVPNQPAIVRNIAILRSWLGQTARATEDWRLYASLDDVPLDDAVEAEALAQLLENKAIHDTVDQVSVTFPVHDSDALMELFLSDRRADTMPVDPQQMATEDLPPPKGVFYLLDRELPETGLDIARDHIPTVLAEMLLYGKETDREARLEMLLEKLPDFDDRTAALKALAGDLIGDATNEEVTAEVSASSAVLSWRWRMPDDTPPDQRQSLLEEQHREILLQRWPDVPHSDLDGKSPREAAADPDYKIRALAAVLLMELASESNRRGFDFNEIRNTLGLPQRDTIQSGDVDIRTVSTVRFAKLDVQALNDEDLIVAFRRARLKQYKTAIHNITREIIRRKPDAQINLSEVYGDLIDSSSTSEEALEAVEEAKAYSAGKNESPAQWLLAELAIRLPRLEGERCNELFQIIRTRHIQEPGIAQSLHELLVRYGILQPDGQPGGPPGAGSEMPPDAGAASPGGLWTPDSPQPPDAPGQGEGKSKIWLPD